VARRFVPPPLPNNSQASKEFAALLNLPNAGAPRARTPWKTALTVLVLAGILFFHSWRRDYLLGELAVPILAVGTLHGLWRGGFRKIVFLAATVALLYAAAVALPNTGQANPTGASSSGDGWGYVIVCGVVIIVLLFIALVTRQIHRRLIVRRPYLRTMDRLLGMAVGFVEAALIPLAVCWTAVAAHPHLLTLRDHGAEIGASRQQFVASLVQIADEARTSAVGSLVDATNPIDRVPVLRKIFNDLNNYGQIRLDDMGNLDPATAEKLNELLKQSPLGPDVLQWLKENQQQSTQTAEQFYRQLPSQRSR
jgi:hypothetical protein